MVCDAETRSGLAAIRDLTSHGVSVIAASHKQHALGFYSRHTHDTWMYPHPGSNRVAFIDALRKRMHGEEILPMSFTDVTTDALRDVRLENTALMRSTPNDDAYRDATNKRALGELCLQLGLPTPVVHRSAGDAIEFPCIVKPVRSVFWREGKAFRDTARVVASKDALSEVINFFLEHTGEQPLIQHMLAGDEYGVSLIAHEGHIDALFVHHRLRSITLHGGVSTLRESVEVTPEIRRIAESFVRAFAWNGVMMIELKQDNATGALTVIEINARFWGSLYLAIASGISFPYYLYLLSRGKMYEIHAPSYPSGIEARHMVTDLSHFYALGTKAFLPTHLKEFFTFYKKNLYYDVWSLSDPLPGIAEIVQFLRKKL